MPLPAERKLLLPCSDAYGKQRQIPAADPSRGNLADRILGAAAPVPERIGKGVRRFPAPDQRDRPREESDHRGHSHAVEPLLWDFGATLA